MEKQLSFESTTLKVSIENSPISSFDFSFAPGKTSMVDVLNATRHVLGFVKPNATQNVYFATLPQLLSDQLECTNASGQLKTNKPHLVDGDTIYVERLDDGNVSLRKVLPRDQSKNNVVHAKIETFHVLEGLQLGVFPAIQSIRLVDLNQTVTLNSKDFDGCMPGQVTVETLKERIRTRFRIHHCVDFNAIVNDTLVSYGPESCTRTIREFVPSAVADGSVSVSLPRQLVKFVNSDTCPVVFYLNVKNLKGATRTFWVRLDSTVYDLKLQVQQSEGIHVNQQRLFFAGQRLQDKKRLTDYGITKESRIQLVLRQHGDMFPATSSRDDVATIPATNQKERYEGPCISLNLILPTGDCKQVKIGLSETIGHLKKRVASMITPHPNNKQTLDELDRAAVATAPEDVTEKIASLRASLFDIKQEKKRISKDLLASELDKEQQVRQGRDEARLLISVDRLRSSLFKLSEKEKSTSNALLEEEMNKEQMVRDASTTDSTPSSRN